MVRLFSPLPLLAVPLGALAIAAAPAGAASGDIHGVCPKGSNNHRVISATGPQASCATAVPTMKAWTKAKKPKLFRSYICGEVKRTKIGFHADKRWFATWQCVMGGKQATYTIWTRY
jgi:hypothetical protein